MFSKLAVVACILVAPLAAQNENRPFVVHDTRPLILNGPYLLAPTETSVTVVWTTDTPCHSKVVYGEGEALTREAVAVRDGLLKIGTRHAVQVTGLEPGKTYRYRAVSTRVVKMRSYFPEKGLDIESPVYSFTTFDRRKTPVAFDLITDSHEDTARIRALTAGVDWSRTDFLVHLGDAFHGIESEEAIWAKFLDPVSEALQHRAPLLYARGNHETRGAAARALPDYLPLPEGRFYYTRDHGPLHLIVLDTGEDKDDNTNVYARLNAFKAYREEELAWFREHVRTDPRVRSAPFRILLLHAPHWNWVAGQGEQWTAAANEAGIDLAIGGHFHRFYHHQPGQNGKKYHEVALGQDQLGRVEATARELKVTITNRDGSVAESFTIPAH